jgi:Uncharacterized protein conserved in bacteria
MKQPGEELQETLTELDDRAVVDYLIKNPEFFIRNARAVEAIRVPHPVRGTVSLVEWHMARARNHIHVLEENMALLMEQAIANEGLFYRLLYLQRSLTAASSLDDMLMRFHRWARDLGLAGASLRLFPDRWRLGAPSNHTHLALSRQSFEPLRIQRLGQEQHYLGPLNGPSCWWCYRKRKRWDRWRCRCWEAMLIWVLCCLPVAMPVTINKGKERSYFMKLR